MQYLKEHERCSFGRGFEAARRGEPRSANPFHPETSQHEWWNDGYDIKTSGKYAALNSEFD